MDSHAELLNFLLSGPTDYAAAKAHAEAFDARLGLATEAIEKSMSGARGQPGQELWLGLPTQTLLTPYTELLQIVRELGPLPESVWVDLGAAYGRLGVVLGLVARGTKFVGYELVSSRVQEGNRMLASHGFSDAQLVCQDLAAPDFKPLAADCYFLYDYGTRADVEKTLDDLKGVASLRPITVVARGRGSRNWIDRGQPWLSQVVPAVHRPHYSIYRSA